MSEKKKRLFYYEEAVGAWVPAPEKLDGIVSIDNFMDEEEETEIKFRIFIMTDKEMEDLPVN